MAGRATKTRGLADFMKGEASTSTTTRPLIEIDRDLRKFTLASDTSEFAQMLADGKWGCLAAQIVGLLDSDATGADELEKTEWMSTAIKSNSVQTPFLQRWRVSSDIHHGIWTMLSDRSIIHIQDKGPKRGIAVRAYIQLSLLPGRTNGSSRTKLIEEGQESHCARTDLDNLFVTNGSGGGLAGWLATELGCDPPEFQ